MVGSATSTGQVAERQYNQYLRDPDTNKRYGRAWRRIRALYIQVASDLQNLHEQRQIDARRGSTSHPAAGKRRHERRG